MKLVKSLVAGAAVLAVAGGTLIAGAGAASAATTPTYYPDATSIGTLSFYDTAGHQVTSGTFPSDPNGTTPFVGYFKASGGAIYSGATKAGVAYATPQDGILPAGWTSVETWTSTQTQPATGLPGDLAGTTDLVVSEDSGISFANHISNFPNISTPNAGVYQIRMYSNGPSGLSTEYYSGDIKVTLSGSTYSWTQVYPEPVAAVATSVSAISASPASPAPAGTASVTLTSTVSAADSSHPAGSVHLFDGATDLGAATFTAATGAISANVASPASGAHAYQFVFTPSTSAYTGSSSAVLAYTVKGAAAATTAVVTGPTTGSVGDAITFTATVAPSAAAGKVQFAVDGTNSGSPVTVSGGTASFQYTLGDTTAHAITAAFVPTDSSDYTASADTVGVVVTGTAVAYQPDPQTFVVNVPRGNLVISTPYTPANPFSLGDLVLSADGTSMATAPVSFGDPAAPAATDPTGDGVAANGVTITDTRPSSIGWTASIQTTDFTSTTTTPIDGNNLAFSNVTPKFITGNHLQSGDVTTSDVAGFKTTKKQFAHASAGPGTVNVTGTFSLTAPTSTIPGLYTATVTFTIV